VQIGDGQALAERLRIPVVWDFRAADMNAGGQGAPLAPVFHRALAETAGLEPPILFLNIGGVANVTYVGAGGELIAFDTGPGNGLLDDWVLGRTGKPFDVDGRLAASGTPSEEILHVLLSHSYFALTPPKSLDRNTFAVSALAALSDADGAATLLQFSSRSAAAALRHLPERPRHCFASGGGRHNVALMQALRNSLQIPLLPLEEAGFDGDATEAQAFAFLAVRSLRGMPLSYPLTTGVSRPTTGGIHSTPSEAS
jgi:anhydro-N-acetylmuramic acid kinase